MRDGLKAVLEVTTGQRRVIRRLDRRSALGTGAAPECDERWRWSAGRGCLPWLLMLGPWPSGRATRPTELVHDELLADIAEWPSTPSPKHARD